MRLRFLNYVDERFLEEIRTTLKANGFVLYEIDGTGVTDTESLFHQLIAVLPMDPPVHTAHWDAFIDSVWEGFAKLAEEQDVTRIALIWTKVENMLAGGLSDLLDAVIVFTHLAGELIPQAGLKNRVEFVVFLAGSGPNFRDGKSLEIY